MKTINLKKYGPIISDKIIGDKIYTEINDLLKTESKVAIDFSEIISMATFCAKQIFGKIYIDLSPELFFEKLEFTNVTNDVKLIIKIGIQNALEEIN